jgi:hypothetical protein
LLDRDCSKVFFSIAIARKCFARDCFLLLALTNHVICGSPINTHFVSCL